MNGRIPAAGRADPASFSGIIKAGKSLRGFPEPHGTGISSPIPQGWELLSALLPAWITQWGSLAQLSVRLVLKFPFSHSFPAPTLEAALFPLPCHPLK